MYNNLEKDYFLLQRSEARYNYEHTCHYPTAGSMARRCAKNQNPLRKRGNANLASLGVSTWGGHVLYNLLFF